MKVESAKRHTISEVNSWEQAAFTLVLGPIFEHSPWIAERTWPRRPFGNLEALHRSLCETVLASTAEEKLALIRAHPDLVGRVSLAGALTASSAEEQTSAGLDKLSADEVKLFGEYNQAYRDKFGFPFVICARLNKKAAILDGFRARLDHAHPEEIKSALDEIGKIAYLRLQDIIHP